LGLLATLCSKSVRGLLILRTKEGRLNAAAYFLGSNLRRLPSSRCASASGGVQPHELFFALSQSPSQQPHFPLRMEVKMRRPK
jgi:hypothetical protein